MNGMNHGIRHALLTILAVTACFLMHPLPLQAQSCLVKELNKGSRYVVLCAQGGGQEWYSVARCLAGYRKAASIVHFNVNRTRDLQPYLKKIQPENVAYVVPPTLITPHLAGKLAELSSRIRNDKLINYASGYITGITAKDALALVKRTITLEKRGKGLPRTCSAVGHSWYRMNRGRYLMLFSRESGKGPKLILTTTGGRKSSLEARADVMIAESNPDFNYQRGGRRTSLMVAMGDASRSLIRFDLKRGKKVKKAVLEMQVDASRWRLGGRMVLGASPVTGSWKEESVNWNNAPDCDRERVAKTEAGPATRTIRLDLTAMMANLKNGVILHCLPSGEQDNKNLLRHMYFLMQKRVETCKSKGFEGQAIEALHGKTWSETAVKKLSCFKKGGIILFGGHGSGTVSCVVGKKELEKIDIGPSVVFNGTCFAAATHRIVKFAYTGKKHSLMRTIPPEDSFALIMLKKGSVGYFGGTGSCSFGHVNPGIEMIRDRHFSLGRTIQTIQNHFIKQIPARRIPKTFWEALSHRPGDPGFEKATGITHPTMIQYTIRTICFGDPAHVPYPEIKTGTGPDSPPRGR